MRASLLLLLVAIGCARRAPPPASPAISYEAHLAEAARLEGEATRHAEAAEVARQRGPAYQCDTSPETEQATSGTERFYRTRVCDDVSLADQRRHQREAGELRREAERHRALARSMLDSERGACGGLDLERMRDTPLGRSRTRATVEPVDGGVRVSVPAPRGVRLEEVRREMACHRARAALYDATEYMGHDPALVPGTRLTIDLSGATLVFTIRGDDGVAADIARQRARALGAPAP